MTEDAGTYTQAEIVRLLKRLDGTVGELRTDLRRLESNYVTRAEWDMWKEANERPKANGWAIAGVVVSAVVGLGSLITLTIVLIQNIR
jgi:ElaB/YqjD/DUF883 family membrane-anchored ribosome-binding protein